MAIPNQPKLPSISHSQWNDFKQFLFTKWNHLNKNWQIKWHRNPKKKIKTKQSWGNRKKSFFDTKNAFSKAQINFLFVFSMASFRNFLLAYTRNSLHTTLLKIYWKDEGWRNWIYCKNIFTSVNNISLFFSCKMRWPAIFTKFNVFSSAWFSVKCVLKKKTLVNMQCRYDLDFKLFI